MSDTPTTETPLERAEDANPLLRWREYLHVLNERKWIAITVFVVVVVSVALWTVRQTPVYRASARLQVDMSADRILNIPDVLAQGTPGYMFGQYINTLVKGIRSRIFIERVVDSLKESGTPEARTFFDESPSPVDTILASTSVSPVEESRLIDITVRHPNRETTALLANAVAEQFIKQDLSRRMNVALSALQWLRQQADDQKAKLAASELAIQEYREKTGMVSLEQRQDIVVSKLKAVSDSLTQAETVLTVAEARWQEVRVLWEKSASPADIPAIASDPLVVAAKKNIAELDAKVTALKLRYKAKHPTLIEAVADLSDAIGALAVECQNAKARTEREYELAKAKVDGLRESLKAQERQALELSRMMVQYTELKRNAEADQQLYESILTRMKETDLAGKLETTNLRLNDRAHVPSAPFKPRKMQNLIRGAGVGAILGLLLVLVVHLMDDRVRRVEDFEVSLGVPVLGMIPRVPMGVSSQRASASMRDPDSHAAEAFRGLRANLMLDPVGRDAHIIMVVSAGAAEGKSLVSTNLATVFAQHGQRTLLIDADLRRPSIHRLFDVRGHKGLPHLLAGDVTWEDAVCSTQETAFDLLTGSGAPSSPARLLASPAMKRTLDEARDRYERVIVDCPPLFGVSDPLLLLPHVDGVILVSLYNRTHRRAIREATQQLLEGETPILGAVINGVELTSHSYYYHRYGYKYYYGREPDANKHG